MTSTFHAKIVSACFAITLAGPSASSEPESLSTVLARAGAYVAEFHRQLSSIVGEERYVQDWTAIQKGFESSRDDVRRAFDVTMRKLREMVQ